MTELVRVAPVGQVYIHKLGEAIAMTALEAACHLMEGDAFLVATVRRDESDVEPGAPAATRSPFGLHTL
ncbi:hypothetical protein [Amycolatopsis sp.]|uniref:hypothetical protein n=1 Tax=Amycolatopsis sp. TaxID=37632 RepID=UPI002B5A2258|nr:hypothetical protein [Amycolatopsis sp.]HVV12051.1 hypothetical protein [Amycolatopsis sp.]